MIRTPARSHSARWTVLSALAMIMLGAAPCRTLASNPTGVGAFSPCGCISINVTPGQLPTSTGITVVVDLSALGGSATATARDDGVAPDAVANDGIGTLCGIVPPITPILVPFVVMDAQARSSTGFVSVGPPALCPSSGGTPVTSFYDVTGVATNTPFSISAGSLCCFGFYIPSVPGVVPSGVQSTDEANLRDAFVNAVNGVCPGLATSVPFNGTSTTVFGRFAIATNCISGMPADVGVGPANSPAAAHCVVALGNPSGCVFNPTITGTPGSGLDCDGNGIDDALQIALCISTDINQNGVPDMCESVCGADLDDGTGSGTPDAGVDINDLIYFLTEFSLGTAAADIDDDGDPCIAVPGGAVPDINDLLFFLAHFEIGC